MYFASMLNARQQRCIYYRHMYSYVVAMPLLPLYVYTIFAMVPWIALPANTFLLRSAGLSLLCPADSLLLRSTGLPQVITCRRRATGHHCILTRTPAFWC